MKRAPGWWWRGPGVAAYLVATGLAVCLPGWVLVHVSGFIERL